MYIIKYKIDFILFGFLTILFTVVSNTVLPLYGQESVKAFSEFKIGAGITTNYNDNLIHRFWNAKNGFEFNIESPFYFGDISVGVKSIPYTGKDVIYPDFRENLVYLGLGRDISLPFKLSLHSGVIFGYFLTNYNDDTLSVYQKNESEFSAGVNFGLSFPIAYGFDIKASTDFTVLFSHDLLKFYYVTAGLSYKFVSPEWLRNFFN